MLSPIYFVIKKDQKSDPTFFYDSHSQVASLSCKSFADIQHFFTVFQAAGLTSKKYADALKKKFPYIKKIIMHAHNVGHRYKVTLYADKPIARINQALVLTDHDVITDVAIWDTSVLANIPNFTVASNDQGIISLKCKKFVKKMNFLQAYNDYNIEWVDNFLIKFHDKGCPQLTMLARPETAGTVLLSSHYKKFRELVIEEKCTTLKGQKKWCIDTRFKNQMIVFEGEKHEKFIRS